MQEDNGNGNLITINIQSPFKVKEFDEFLNVNEIFGLFHFSFFILHSSFNIILHSFEHNHC